jgi:hypothetical protein
MIDLTQDAKRDLLGEREVRSSLTRPGNLREKRHRVRLLAAIGTPDRS